MDTESDQAILEVSLTEEEERETGDTDRHEATDTADEKRESVLGDQEDPGRVDEGGDCLGHEDGLEDTQRVQEKGGNTEKCDVVTVHQESSGKIVLEMSSSFFRDRSLFSAPVLPFDPIGNSLDRFRFFAFTPTEG